MPENTTSQMTAKKVIADAQTALDKLIKGLPDSAGDAIIGGVRSTLGSCKSLLDAESNEISLLDLQTVQPGG